ncbi:O-antigen/teichoic acid export membrane protein [Nocardioides thalensis]|uniref:O-antigen/teichoic acid export membrane protein n=1 Tax=Nocardioides thalensis TaxID=1914755 RepID=A0A853C349_9ACTN|nr:oligosaccharide flippase family protein [Nocardioides thalensis]NYJ01436.1 O-antigen/teichoic acid export membrane protein [Nocardioides thalensis]
MTGIGTADQGDTLRRTGAAVVSLAASELLGKVATLLTILVMARLLGVADFGVLTFGLSIGLLLAVLSSLGLDSRVVQLGSARPELLDRCYGALAAIRLALSVAVLVPTAAILFATMDRGSAAAVWLLVASCLADTLSDAARSACGALQRQHLASVMLVVHRFATLAFTAGALLLSPSAAHAALGYLAGTCVGVVAMHVAAHRAGARLVVRGSRRAAGMVMAAAPVTAVESMASMAVFRIDTAMIGVMLGSFAVGEYGAGYRLLESIVFVSWTLSRAYVPVIASRPGDLEHVRTWAQRALLVVCAVYLPYGVVTALRGDDLVRLLFGADYVHHGVQLGLAAAPLLFGVMHLGATVLLALRPNPVVLVASLSAVALNIGLNLFLIPRWGITAAAVSTCLAFLLQSVVLMRALTRITGSIVPVPALGAVVVASLAAGAAVQAVEPLGLALSAGVLVFLLAWEGATRLLDPRHAGVRSQLTAGSGGDVRG